MARPPSRPKRASLKPLPKTATGIAGFDEITGGGLPTGRPTLVCGGAGSGKTLFGLEFVLRGATSHREPGVFMTFEETADDLAKNVASLGYDLPALIAAKKVVVDFVQVERSEIEETGEYDLEGLFVRLDHGIRTVGAKRVCLDTLEALFAGLSDTAILRAELRRLFRWLKDRGMTAVITAERGAEGGFTRHGLEEYVSDAVILLDHRVEGQISTRRLRVVKYRGSAHGTNEYPFLIDRGGIEVLPVTSIGLEHRASSARVSTGIAALDDMLGGRGYYRGTSVLVSGSAGAGKSTLAAHFVEAASRRGERCLQFLFEESPNQVLRNMRSVGIDLATPLRRGLVRFEASRPTSHGLEMHLAIIHRAIEEFRPRLVVFDPVTALLTAGNEQMVRAMLLRLMDFLKVKNISALFTTLTHGVSVLESDVGISSLMDTWIALDAVSADGERNRLLGVIKSRGMAHSNQLREFIFTGHGVRLIDVHVGPAGVVTGSARVALEAQERATSQKRAERLDHRRRDLQYRRDALAARIAALRARFRTQEAESLTDIGHEEARALRRRDERRTMGLRRGARNGVPRKRR